MADETGRAEAKVDERQLNINKQELAGPLAGRCVCGHSTYTVERGFRLGPYACHCKDCQRRSGSALAMQLGVMTSDLIISGDLVQGHYVMSSGAKATYHACTSCLGVLYVTNDSWAGFANLRIGTLDNSVMLKPVAHFWTKDKASWVNLDPDIPALETQPASLDEWMSYLKHDA